MPGALLVALCVRRLRRTLVVFIGETSSTVVNSDFFVLFGTTSVDDSGDVGGRARLDTIPGSFLRLRRRPATTSDQYIHS